MFRFTFVSTIAAGAIFFSASAAFAGPPEPTPKPGPPDKIVFSDGREAMQKLDKAIAPLVVRAKKNYPPIKARFLKGLPKGQRFYVTYPLREKDGNSQERVFITVQSIKAGKITGVIASNLERMTTYKRGQVVTFPEADILDWTISRPDGTEEGNIVGKFLDTYKP